MNIEEIAGKIREKVAGSGFDRSVKLDLQDAGTVIVDGTNVTTGDGDADCTITMTADDFLALASGDLNATAAFMQGKMKIAGDMSVAMALSQVL